MLPVGSLKQCQVMNPERLQLQQLALRADGHRAPLPGWMLSTIELLRTHYDQWGALVGIACRVGPQGPFQ